MATDTRFIMSIMSGIMNVITRFVNSCVFMRRRFASSKRSSSCDSRPNARTTGMPVRISRDTRFTRSMSFCMILNFGIATFMRNSITTAMASTAATMIQPIERFVRAIMIMPPMAKMGAYRIMRSIMTDTICTCCTSLVPRVMSEAAEKLWISASANDSTRSNKRLRKLAPIFAAVRLAMKPTITAMTMPSAARPSIFPPVVSR